MNDATPPSAVDLPQDPTLLARFGRLDVVARLLVEGYMVGQHKSPFKGASVEFVEHRQYYPGDEVRHIDWRAYGKTGRYFVKQFEAETNLRSMLLVDVSGSMGYGGSTVRKIDYARQLAAALGYLLLSQRDAVGLITFDREIRDQVEPSARPQVFQRMIQSLEQARPGGDTHLAGALRDVLKRLPRRCLAILLSDCFDKLEPLEQVMQQFRHMRHQLLLLQIVAPEEETFPFSRPTQFRSLERERNRLLVDPHLLRKHYLEQYREFNDRLRKAAAARGVDFEKFVTNQPYAQALGAFLARRTARSRRG